MSFHSRGSFVFCLRTERELMAIETPRLLAASLAIALIGSSCSAPIDTSNKVSEDLANDVDLATGTSPITADKPASPPTRQAPAQEQEQAPPTIAEQRAAALAEHWLENARKLRASGKLQAAKLELLKAKDVAPGNQVVTAKLAELRAELGEPAPDSANPAGSMRMPVIAAQRARAMVQWQLQSAQGCMVNKDYTGAIEKLRGAALQIRGKNDIDWGDLPAQVKAAREKAVRLSERQE